MYDVELTFFLWYRNIKPTSILLKVDHERPFNFGTIPIQCVTAKLGGFDFYRSEDEEDLLSRPDRYMAPELLDGQGPSFSGDCYSVGVIVFELLLHRTPGFREGESPHIDRGTK